MGNSPSIIQKANYEDIQNLNSYSETILINTLSVNEQNCLIANTINYNEEENIINALISNGNLNKKIIIYGKNYTDYSMYKKYEQIKQLGFTNVYIYVGGLFEWLLLQDIYGTEVFPTTSNEKDFLKFKGQRKISMKMLNV